MSSSGCSDRVKALLGGYHQTDVEFVVERACRLGGIVARSCLPEQMKRKWIDAQEIRLVGHFTKVYESKPLQIFLYGPAVFRAFGQNPSQIETKVHLLFDRCLSLSLVLAFRDQFQPEGVNLFKREITSVEGKVYKLSSFSESLSDDMLRDYHGIIGYAHDAACWENVIVPPWGSSRWVDKFVRDSRY